MKYFQNFPQVNYDVFGDSDYITPMTDFTPGFKIRGANLIKNASYMNYTIGDGERPDVSSHILYGTAAYHWTFFIVNEHLRKGISEWPFSQNELDRYVSAKYDNLSVVTFDPRVIPDGTYGNLSYVPFNDFADSLYLVAYNDTSEVARCMIKTYDTLSCQMILHRDTFTGAGTVDNFVNNYQSYKIISDAAVSNAFEAALDTMYGVQDAKDFSYKIALDKYENNLNYELMKNASFMFYEIGDDDLPISISAYDVIDGADDDPDSSKVKPFVNVKRITYYEMEETLNNRKRTITVINPANIASFAQSYFDVLNNG